MPSVVVTVPDKPKGRGLQMTEPATKTWAKENGVTVLQPEKLDDAFFRELSGYDLFVVAGFGRILPQELLDAPKFGTLNVHPSLLPAYRGPSPIESQILADEKTVGVSVILLDEETDHGPVLVQKSFAPEKWPMMRSELENLLWSEGGALLAGSIPSYVEGALKPIPQNHDAATFTPKLSKDDGLLDLSADPYKNYLKYCAYEGWPGAYFFAERGGKKIRVKIALAEYANGEMKILRVVPEGKREMDYTDFLRSA
jgi:methionyl-tRNA formyltransferase